MCSAQAHPTPSQLSATLSDWQYRSQLIAHAAGHIGADAICKQLSQLGLDLMQAAAMAEQATRASGRHDPTTLSLMLGSVDVRLWNIEHELAALAGLGAGHASP
jgi:hypothetical protein